MPHPTKYGAQALIRTGLDDDELLDYEAVGKMTALKVGTLRWLVHEQRIPHLRFGPRTVRFEQQAIKHWIAARKVGEQA